MEPYTLIGPDESNPLTRVVIEVRGSLYSVPIGKEQSVADEIATNKQ